MTSAAFSINSTSVPQSSGAAVETTYGATVSLALTSITGANSIDWTILGTSGPSVAAPTITRAGTPLGATATFTAGADPGDGKGIAYHVRCTVTDATGARYYAYGIVGVPNIAGAVPGVPGEELARHATLGWGPLFNDALMGFPYYSGSATTTGSSVAVATTVLIPPSKVARIDCVWSAYDATAGERLFRQATALFECDAAGTSATQLGSDLDVFDVAEDATWAAVFATTGSSVAIRYSGDATNSTTWRIYTWRTMVGN